MWFGHFATFCQTYWSSAILGVVTTSYGLFRMNPSTGLCVKYDWYDSVKGLLCWYSSVLTERLSFNRETANNRWTFDEVKALRLRAATNFDNILDLFLIIANKFLYKHLRKENRYCSFIVSTPLITNLLYFELFQQVNIVWFRSSCFNVNNRLLFSIEIIH